MSAYLHDSIVSAQESQALKEKRNPKLQEKENLSNIYSLQNARGCN